MRVAVLADIHGNLPALDAVLRDVGETGADVIVLNGDMADGPMPAQTLERLAGPAAARCGSGATATVGWSTRSTATS